MKYLHSHFLIGMCTSCNNVALPYFSFGYLLGEVSQKYQNFKRYVIAARCVPELCSV